MQRFNDSDNVLRFMDAVYSLRPNEGEIERGMKNDGTDLKCQHLDLA